MISSCIPVVNFDPIFNFFNVQVKTISGNNFKKKFFDFQNILFLDVIRRIHP